MYSCENTICNYTSNLRRNCRVSIEFAESLVIAATELSGMRRYYTKQSLNNRLLFVIFHAVCTCNVFFA